MSWNVNRSRAAVAPEAVADMAPGPTPLHTPLLVGRWSFAIAVSYAVIFQAGDFVDTATKQIFVGVVLIVMAVSHVALRRNPTGSVRGAITLLDIGVVAGAMLLGNDPTTDFFLAFFAVVTFAAFSHGTLAASIYSLLIAAVYGGVLFADLGIAVFRTPDPMMRLAFLFSAGLFFSIVADESKRQKKRASSIEERMKSVASHAKTLARDKYRLRALSEIGRLGLVGSAASDSDVLYEISKRVQKGVGVDRCSLVVFAQDGHTGYVAASGDDASVEVRPLSVEEYPELQETLANGEITEVHPNNPPELWRRISSFLPDTNAFSSFLVVPIKAGEKVFGAFYLRDRDASRSFDDEERDFCWASALMTASFIRGRDLLEQLRVQSRVDGLTGLLNFQAFTDEMHRVLNAPDAAQTAPYTLVVVDMDNLKQINDQHGHVAGNRGIVEMGQRLRQALPESLAMCRYGGDEFVTLVHAPLDHTVSQLNGMLNVLTTMEWDAPFDLRASIGVASYPSHADNAEVLLEAADQAMYLAKGGGGHRVRQAQMDQDQNEVYDAVVQVQTRRIVPNVMEEFTDHLAELRKRTILGLQAPVVKESIAALMQSVELKDPHSALHSAAVAELSRDLAAAVGMAPDHVLLTEMAGHLHDVGKIRLPEEILQKTTALDDNERSVVQRTPDEGADILAALPGLRQIAEVVRACQERWDGSGYPHQLTGDKIPLAAQIVGICDVYNALTSPRAQRPAMEEHRARRLIEQGMGTDWNPRLARVFLDMVTGAAQGAASDAETSQAATARRGTG
jgi:diguanylate cyclase (GGDEF)-like protein